MQKGKQLSHIPQPTIFRLLDSVYRLRARFSFYRRTLENFRADVKLFRFMVSALTSSRSRHR